MSISSSANSRQSVILFFIVHVEKHLVPYSQWQRIANLLYQSLILKGSSNGDQTFEKGFKGAIHSSFKITRYILWKKFPTLSEHTLFW